MLGVCGLFGCSKAPDVKDKALVSCSCWSGGGMTGGGDSTEIGMIDGEVILTESDTEWWYEDAAITEYRLDSAVLADIESVFRKYHMQNWHNRKFSDMFVADGPSFGYSFTFEDGTAVSFSSQVYPMSYSQKLAKLKEVIEQYRQKGTLEPGLVAKEQTPEELADKRRPHDGKVALEVYEYSRDRVWFRILNGTDEDVEVRNAVRLVRNSDGKVLYDESSQNPITVAATSAEEVPLVTGRLAEGVYTLYVGDDSTEFAIRLPEDT